jgi:hypothetical protein
VAQNAEHTFEAYTSPSTILKNQKRQIMGQTMVHVLVDQYLNRLPAIERQDLGRFLRTKDAGDPFWLKRLITEHLGETRFFWRLYPGLLSNRFKHLRRLGLAQRLCCWPAALAGSSAALIASFMSMPSRSRTFDATAVASFTLSTAANFYVGKDIYFTSGNLNGQRGRITGYNAATQTFQFAAHTFTAAPAAGSTFQIESSDTGRSQLDNITRDTTPTIFLRLPNVINVNGTANLDDVPFNGSAPGNPPDEFIPIPFSPDLALDATNPGFRVPIFITENGTSDQGPPNNVLAGYAQPVEAHRGQRPYGHGHIPHPVGTRRQRQAFRAGSDAVGVAGAHRRVENCRASGRRTGRGRTAVPESQLVTTRCECDRRDGHTDPQNWRIAQSPKNQTAGYPHVFDSLH